MTDVLKRIVGGLRYCGYEVPCEGCPREEDRCNSMSDIMKVAANTIKAMDKDNDQLCSLRDSLCARIDLLMESLQKTQQLLDEVTRERDAAINDINAVLRGKRLICAMCDQEICPEYGNEEKPSGYCDEAKWRGLRVENGGKPNAE